MTIRFTDAQRAIAEKAFSVEALLKKWSQEEFNTLLLDLEIDYERIGFIGDFLHYNLSKEVPSSDPKIIENAFCYANVKIDRALINRYPDEDKESFIYKELIIYVEALYREYDSKIN